jgi:hypothetical protein
VRVKSARGGLVPLVGALLGAACLLAACSTSSSNGGGAGGEQCVAIDAGSCMGEPVSFCSVLSAGASTCTSAHYQVGSRVIACQSCSAADLEACGEQMTMACLPEGGVTGSDAAPD